MTLKQRTELINKATTLLREAVNRKDIQDILNALSLIETDKFSWDEIPESVYDEWDELVDEANDILYN